MVQCNTCKGTYAPFGADGVQYFHRCPPLSGAEIGAQLDAGTRGFVPGRSAAFYQTQAKAADDPGVTVQSLAIADWLARGPIERDNLRDENIVVDRTTGAVTMKAEGTGVTELPDAPGALGVL